MFSKSDDGFSLRKYEIIFVLTVLATGNGDYIYVYFYYYYYYDGYYHIHITTVRHGLMFNNNNLLSYRIYEELYITEY